MTPEHEETLSAMFDGEAVDADALRAALAEPDAADVLLSFAALRLRVQGDEAPSPTLAKNLAALADGDSASPGWWSRTWRVAVPAALVGGAAAAMLVFVAAKRPRSAGIEMPDGPPQPDLVVEFALGHDTRGRGR